MRTTRVAAVSMNGFLGEPGAGTASIDALVRNAAAEAAELVLFPELVIHGHCTPNTWELAEPVPDGPSVEKLVDIAKRHHLVLCAGLSEKERDIVYNTQVLVGPHGYIGKQRKLHLSRDEAFYYKGGREIPVFDIGPCKVGIVICYDNQFPEIARVLALRGAEVHPDAARRPLQTLGRHARERGRRPPLFAQLSQEIRPAGPRECVLRDPDRPGRPGGTRRPLAAATARTSPTTPAPP